MDFEYGRNLECAGELAGGDIKLAIVDILQAFRISITSVALIFIRSFYKKT